MICHGSLFVYLNSDIYFTRTKFRIKVRIRTNSDVDTITIKRKRWGGPGPFEKKKESQFPREGVMSDQGGVDLLVQKLYF